MRKTEKRVRWRGNESLQKGEKMVRLGIRALISRISRRQATPKPPTLLNSDMVYTYSAPFDTGKLKVSDVHSLQLVSSSRPPNPLHPPCSAFFGGVLNTREDSYEVSGNRDGAPGAFHGSPRCPAFHVRGVNRLIMIMNVG